MPQRNENSRPVAQRVAEVLGSLLESVGTNVTMRRKVMQCLCTATASDAWLWAFVTRRPPKKVVVPVGMVLQEGLLPGRLAAWIAAAQEQHMPLPIIEPIANRLKTGRHFTVIQQSLTTDAEWLAHPTVKKHRLSEEFRDAIYSVRSLGDDECSVACLFRRSGSPYVATDRRVMHLVLSRAERLHDARLNDPLEHQLGLTPAQRVVYALLLQGHRRAEIAEALHVAEVTARDHIRAVLRLYRVRDQLELVCQFHAGRQG